MNDYYINVAKAIGQNQNIDVAKHPSIIEIGQHSEGNNFPFHHTTREDVLKILKTLNLKKAEVILVWKKSDKLTKSHYRPVSILLIFSKVFEQVLAHQITPFLNTVFSCHLSAFRTRCSSLLKNGVKIF